MGMVARHRNPVRGSWPTGLAAGCVALVAAGVYLALSVAQAVKGDDSPISPTGVFISSSPVRVPVNDLGPATRDENSAVGPVAAESATPLPLPAGVVPLKPSERLNQAIQVAAGEDGDHISVSVKRLTDGVSAEFGGDIQYYAASTFKLAVLYEAALRLSRGDLYYDDHLFISDADAAEDLGTSGYLQFEDDGSITVRNLLTPMIEVSDNSSAVTLLHAFGSGNVDDTLRALGIPTMTVNHEELWTTADDLARLMEAIYNGEGVAPAERDMMRSLLLAQTVRSGIPSALQDEIDRGLRVGNKTGTWEGAQHDVAFVESPSGVYVIAVLTDGSYEGWLAMHRVAQTVHQTLAATP
ncbi:MAG: serine hydrolase [bacterium]